MSIKSKIQEYIATFLQRFAEARIKYRWQMLGAGFLLMAFIVGLVRIPEISPITCGILLLAAIPIEIYLDIRKLRLISPWVQHLFGEKVDKIIIFIAFGLVLWRFWDTPATGLEVINFSAMGILKGHFFANGN